MSEAEKLKKARRELRELRAEIRELNKKLTCLEDYKSYVREIHEVFSDGNAPNRVYFLKLSKRFWR